MRFFTALLAATLPLLSSGQAQLLPAGEFSARDGRPGPGKTWKVTDERGQALAAELSATARRTPVVIDYEHQTLHTAANGQPAPAAGWIKSVAWRPGEGLFADVNWTAAAKARIDAGEYLFISPVITFDAEGNVTGVAMAALTNFPALLGMDAAVAALNAQQHHQHQQQQQEPAAMNPTLAALITALGLAATATEAEALSAVATLRTDLAALQARPTLPAALTTALGLAATADETAALSAVHALRGADTGTLAMVTALQGQVAALTAQLNETALSTLVDGAIAANKFAPAHREWLLGQGRKDFAALTAAINAAPVIPGLAGQSAGRSFDGTAALTTEAAKLQAAFGLTPEQFAKGAPAKA